MPKLRDKEQYLEAFQSVDQSWDERIANVPKNTALDDHIVALIDKLSQYADKLTRKELEYMKSTISSFENNGSSESLKRELEYVLVEAQGRK